MGEAVLEIHSWDDHGGRITQEIWSKRYMEWS